MKENFVSRQQVSLLPERIHKAEETEASHELYNFLWSKYEKKGFEPMHIMLVGAGGSYPAALCASHSIRDEMRTSNVEIATPQTALRTIEQFDRILNSTWNPKYDVVIGISYSGKTPDIKAVADACKMKKFPFVLLTGTKKSELEDIYYESEEIKVISYFNSEDSTGKEKGMISMASTLVPAVIFDDNTICSDPRYRHFETYEEFLEEGKKFVSELDIPRIAASIKKHPVVHVFYEWVTMPTAADIESKFIEAGIANVVLHEKKNFSHGRSTVLYTQDFGLVINLTQYTLAISLSTSEEKLVYKYEYDESLAKFLKEICESKSACYLEMGNSKFEAVEHNIQEMSKIPYLITAIGEEMDIDISKPLKPYPKEAKALYDYQGKF